ncbi:MAG: PIN domain-containing protein [Pseudomonadota bacterium]
MATPQEVPRVIEQDADDDHVIACAVAGQAGLIVSGDKHLHSLGGQHADHGVRSCLLPPRRSRGQVLPFAPNYAAAASGWIAARFSASASRVIARS